VSLASKASGVSDRIKTSDVSYATTPSFNIASIAVVAILCALYASFW
jgi:SSS family solute:Na+ symporter